MKIQEIFEKLKGRFGESVEFQDDKLTPVIKVRPDSIQNVAETLKGTPELGFDSLMCLTAVENPDDFTVVYFLCSMKHGHRLTLKVSRPKVNPSVLTVEKTWPAANWFEREVYDLFGVKFEGHSNMIRIMLPDDWEGHPLRKDYQYPATYRGLPL